MVGVPGKSKGCTTCRRRKIRCDLQEPFCDKCIRSGRVCEGYARYPVFINRTSKGVQKRGRLEEAKGLLSSFGDYKHVESRSMLSNLDFQQGLVESRRAHDNRVFVKPSDSAVLNQQLVSAFWEKYTPSVSVQNSSSWFWLSQVFHLQNPCQALQLSLKALAMTRVGWVNRDEPLALQGNVVYGHALQAVQRSLWDEGMMWQDEIFAAGYALAVYELFESTTPSIAGWNNHISGLGKLVLERGPQRHRSPLALSVFEEYRVSAMIQSIQFRKSSFLGHGDWSVIPWNGKPKDIYQQLYDKGFALATLLDDIDTAAVESNGKQSPVFSTFLQRCSSLDLELDLWLQELIAQSPKPLYWTSDPSTANSGLHPNGKGSERRKSPPFFFSTLRRGYVTVTYWALKIIIGNTITLLCNALLSTGISRRETPVTPPVDTDLEQKCRQLVTQHGPSPLEFATNILRSMEYCLSDSMGLVAAQKCLFGVRVALFAFVRYPGEDIQWCQSIYQRLHSQKGLRYAREIGKLEGKYSSAGRGTLPIREKSPDQALSAQPSAKITTTEGTTVPPRTDMTTF